MSPPEKIFVYENSVKKRSVCHFPCGIFTLILYYIFLIKRKKKSAGLQIFVDERCRDIKLQISDIRCQMSDFGLQISNICHLTSNH